MSCFFENELYLFMSPSRTHTLFRLFCTLIVSINIVVISHFSSSSAFHIHISHTCALYSVDCGDTEIDAETIHTKSDTNRDTNEINLMTPSNNRHFKSKKNDNDNTGHRERQRQREKWYLFMFSAVEFEQKKHTLIWQTELSERTSEVRRERDRQRQRTTQWRRHRRQLFNAIRDESSWWVQVYECRLCVRARSRLLTMTMHLTEVKRQSTLTTITTIAATATY